jgi:hypothetical protein
MPNLYSLQAKSNRQHYNNLLKQRLYILKELQPSHIEKLMRGNPSPHTDYLLSIYNSVPVRQKQ